MSERDEGEANFFLLMALIIFAALVFNLKSCSVDGQLRDLQRRVGQLESVAK